MVSKIRYPQIACTTAQKLYEVTHPHESLKLELNLIKVMELQLFCGTYILKQVSCVASLLRSGGCPVALEGDVHGSGAGLLGPDGRLVLKGCASGVEGVLEVVVQQTAEGRHVDVGEAGETA